MSDIIKLKLFLRSSLQSSTGTLKFWLFKLSDKFFKLSKYSLRIVEFDSAEISGFFNISSLIFFIEEVDEFSPSFLFSWIFLSVEMLLKNNHLQYLQDFLHILLPRCQKIVFC